MKNLKRIKNGKGGSKVGQVIASIAELNEIFGKFEDVSKQSDGKITTQWGFQNGNNYFCIYDYKETDRYSDGLPSLAKFRANNSKQIAWSVGGNTNGDDFIDHVNRELSRLRNPSASKKHERVLKFEHTPEELTIIVMEGYCCAFEARLSMHAADPEEFKNLAKAVEEQARVILK